MSFLPDFPDILSHEIKRLYSAEIQLETALPEISQATRDWELRSLVEEERKFAQSYIRRLGLVADQLGIALHGKTADGMKVIVEERKWRLGKSDLADVAVLSAIQNALWYKIVGYRSTEFFARIHGHAEVAKVLRATLDEMIAVHTRFVSVGQRIALRPKTNISEPPAVAWTDVSHSVLAT
jgi:ferritin-like metal-binding protein YciE